MKLFARLSTFPMIAIVILAVLIGGFSINRFISSSPATSASFSSAKNSAVDPRCSSPQVKVYDNWPFSFDPAQLQRQYPVPANEPAVYATVNGVPIKGYTIELQAKMTWINNQKLLQDQQTLTMMPQNVQAKAHESLNQIRMDLIQREIDNQLLIQTARKLHIAPTKADVQATVQRQITAFKQMPQSSSTWAEFKAILCVNGLNEQTFVSDPRVIQGYTNTMTLQMMRYSSYADLSSAQQQDRTLVSSRVQAYLQQLRKQATITISFVMQ